METKRQEITKEHVVKLFRLNHQIIVSNPKNVETYENYVEAVRALRKLSIRDLRIAGVRGYIRAEMNDALERISHPNHRQYLFHKDPICKICYKLIKSLREATIDHIIPTSKGGPNILANKQIAHSSCNVKKGNKIV